jgi:hypothetical protein
MAVPFRLVVVAEQGASGMRREEAQLPFEGMT